MVAERLLCEKPPTAVGTGWEEDAVCAWGERGVVMVDIAEV